MKRKHTLLEAEPQQDREKPEQAPVEVPVFAFPTRSKCPRCGSVNTVATQTRGRTQYRRCRVAIPVCGKRYAVQGDEVK